MTNMPRHINTVHLLYYHLANAKFILTSNVAMIGRKRFPLKYNVGKALSAITERDKKKAWGSVRSLNAISEREDQGKHLLQRSQSEDLNSDLEAQSEDLNSDPENHESEKLASRFTVLVSDSACQHDDEILSSSDNSVYREFQLEEVNT